MAETTIFSRDIVLPRVETTTGRFIWPAAGHWGPSLGGLCCLRAFQRATDPGPFLPRPDATLWNLYSRQKYFTTYILKHVELERVHTGRP